MEANLKSVTIFLDDDGAALVKPSFQVDPKCIQKVATELKKNII